MDRKTVLVTGGNSGIGLACSKTLAGKGWHVLIAGRNREKSDAAAEEVRNEHGSEAASALPLDLGSPESVRSLVQKVRTRDVHLKALVCNAGLQLPGERRFSDDGFELTFAVNHLGHFLLTHLLLDTLLDHEPARIVVVSSGVHDPARSTMVPPPEYESVEQIARTGGSPEDDYDGLLAYSNSKLCNLWFTYELVRRLKQAEITDGDKPVTVNGFDPGLVPDTALVREHPLYLRLVWKALLPVLTRVVARFTSRVNPAWKSGRALARLVTDPDLEGVTGQYFPSHAGWEAAPSSDASYDEEAAERLWERSVEWTNLSGDESPLVETPSPTA